MSRAGLSVLVAVLAAGCGGQSQTPAATSTPDYAATAQAEVDAAVAADEADGCEEPSGVEKGALRSRVRAHNKELKDSPWAIVRHGKWNYMAAQIDAPGHLVVLVTFRGDGGYLAGMQAVNGTAQTFTDLPAARKMPKGGEQALDCIDNA